MQPADEAWAALSRRLRGLREERHLTQPQLAEALSTLKQVSAPAISAWEKPRGKLPSPERLHAYATFFARQQFDGVLRVPDVSELDEDALGRRDRLLRELLALRTTAASGGLPPETPDPADRPITAWEFPSNQDITIVCAPLPDRIRKTMPYADPLNPDYIEAYTYADVDALIELHGHLRAVNPDNQVDIRRASDVVEDDLTAHLVLLGGVDWNEITREILGMLRLPVRQVSREADNASAWDAWFECGEGDEREEFRAQLKQTGPNKILHQDVAHLFRAENPFNSNRTVTLCNGIYGRGTYGAVRTLTDARLRTSNERWLRSRFGGTERFSVLMRVQIVRTKVLTPDWTQADVRLHEWPEADE
jgi:transcriptional regulator with XRE-family HTH domain